MICVWWHENRHFRDLLNLPDRFLGGNPGLEDFLRLLAQRGEFGPGDVEEMVRVRRAITEQPYFTERARPLTAPSWKCGARRFRRRLRVDLHRYHRAQTGRGADPYREDAAEEALQELKAVQAGLLHAQKMAALGQLTAGIAHEIKNPLNFVTNFAGISIELLDELKESAAPGIATLDDDTRTDVEETVQLLTGNLEKIAEHGKRADNIVKSMLEHSRGVSGEHREIDLNALVDEALNLAYHGARAQDQSFIITLERDFQPSLAPIELAPQEMTRVLFNLFGNGFYAARSGSATAPARTSGRP